MPKAAFVKDCEDTTGMTGIKTWSEHILWDLIFILSST